MDRIALTPILRGAFIAAGGAPLLLRFDEEERPDLPELNLTLPGAPGTGRERKEECRVGREAREALAALAADDGALPAGVRVSGVGSFYAGEDYLGAEAARRGERGRFLPAPPRGRADAVRGRIALVTGGAGGFGAEIARGLAAGGAFVMVADINAEGAERTAGEINAGGPRRALAAGADIADEAAVRGLAETLLSEAGGLDLLVSCAGVLRAGSVLELSARDFDFVTRVNYSAFFLAAKHCAPPMIRQRAGAPSWNTDIVQINSKSGLQGSNRNGAYAGSKFGGLGLVQSFAMELVEHGIKVNAICPGNFFDGPLWSDPDRGLFVQYLRTGKVPGARNVAEVKAFYESKVPMGRGCSAEDVLRALFYCVEQKYETGQALPVTGGQVMLK